MKVFYLVVTILLCLNGSCGDIFTKTYRWTTLADFRAAGWTQFVSAKRWGSPVDADEKLQPLNSNFTNEVWGWKATNTNDRNHHNLEWPLLPEYCGLINATLEIKIYFGVFSSLNYLYPAAGNIKEQNMGFPPPEVEWRTVSTQLNISYETNVKDAYQYGMQATISYGIPAGDVVLIDEVSLTFSADQNDDNCPNSCNHDCEYRAIDCHNFYTCVDWKYKKFHSCNAAEGLAFNPILKTCDIMEDVEGCNKDCKCTYKPHESNCSSYYFCVNTCRPGGCEERHCPPGMTWSTDALGDGSGYQQCVLPANATCEGGEPTLKLP